MSGKLPDGSPREGFRRASSFCGVDTPGTGGRRSGVDSGEYGAQGDLGESAQAVRLSVPGPTVRRNHRSAERLQDSTCSCRSRSVPGGAASGQMAVADLGYPADAREVTLHRLASALRLSCEVHAENGPCRL